MVRTSRKKSPGEPAATLALPCLRVTVSCSQTWPCICDTGVSVVRHVPFAWLARVTGWKVYEEQSLQGDGMTHPSGRSARALSRKGTRKKTWADFQNGTCGLSACWLSWPLIVRGSSPCRTMLTLERKQSLQTHRSFSGECYRNREGKFTEPERPGLCLS